MKARHKRMARVVIAGQLPPPIGGQNVMIARTLDVFRRDGRMQVDHLPFAFTRDWAGARSASLGKVVELIRVVWRLFTLRLRGPIDCLLFPVGGPHMNPILRDVVLLPFCYLTCRTVVLHFHAGGIAKALPGFPPLIRRVVAAVYSRAEGAVSLTAFGRVDPESLGITNVAVVPNVLDDVYSPTSHHGDTGRTVLLYVGHLCEDKGTPQLLRAFSRVAARHDSVELVLMGEPIAPFTHAELDSLIEKLHIRRRVERVGVLRGAEKWSRFNRADLFVFPSQAPESFPLVLIEAMMWSLPVVTTRWRGIPEVIGEPIPGLCFEMLPDLESALEEALDQALRERDQWGSWARRSRSRFLELQELARKEEPLVTYIAGVVGL